MWQLFRKTSFLLCLAMVFVLPAQARAQSQSQASELFERLQQQVFQVRVIDLASGDKYTIGSGFLVSADGLLATNFHVVAAYVYQPEKYRLEVEAHNGARQSLQLLRLDVIHDLALARIEKPQRGFLPVHTQAPVQGEQLFSMGNPQDLGMSIIEGSFNGLVQPSRYEKFLFSGSLNGGMSGGPALNAAGAVIGVNVSKGGEQLSFLVPAIYLQQLLDSYRDAGPSDDFKAAIAEALYADQEQFYAKVLAATPESKTLGKVTIPGKLAEQLKCWGHTLDGDDLQYAAAHRHCRTEDYIFAGEGLLLGNFSYSFRWLSSEALNRFQFYTLMEEDYAVPELYNSYDHEQVNAFTCHTGAVKLASGRWKVSACMRAYKHYPRLHDASMTMASLDAKHEGALLRLGASGISRENASALFAFMMEAIAWND